MIAAGGVTAAGVGALYFNYGRPANPVRIGVIGTGDEGNVLIGAINPNYVEVKAICDIQTLKRFPSLSTVIGRLRMPRNTEKA